MKRIDVYKRQGGRIVAGLVVDALMEEVPALAKYVRRYDYVVAKDGSGDFFTVQDVYKRQILYCSIL